MSYRIKRGKVGEDITKIAWCRLSVKDYKKHCWAAWAGRIFLPVMCKGCEYFGK